MKRTINEILKSYKEYKTLEEECERALEELKQEAIQYMTEQGIDEVVTESAKATYRERITKRFASTEFKKDFPDIYEEYRKPTAGMFFTCS